MPRIERQIKLAVSMADLERLSPSARAGLTAGRLDLSNAVAVGWTVKNGIKRPVAGLAFSCDLLTAAKVCDIIRAQDKNVGDKLTQVWMLKDRMWSRVPWSVPLTVATANGDGGLMIRLNPALFGQEAKPVEAPADAVAPDDGELRIKITKWGEA